MLQATLICAIAAIFLVLERAIPGRELPESPGWYARAAFLNACQLGIVLTNEPGLCPGDDRRYGFNKVSTNGHHKDIVLLFCLLGTGLYLYEKV